MADKVLEEVGLSVEDKILKGPVGQLDSLRVLTQWTGKLYEPQVHNMKKWPYVVFGVIPDSSGIKINLDRKEVHYSIKFETNPGDTAKGRGLLVSMVKWLLGNQWKVTVEAAYVRRKRKSNRKG